MCTGSRGVTALFYKWFLLFTTVTVYINVSLAFHSIYLIKKIICGAPRTSMFSGVASLIVGQLKNCC